MNRTAHVALNWNSLQSSNLQGKSQKRLFFIYLFFIRHSKRNSFEAGWAEDRAPNKVTSCLWRRLKRVFEDFYLCILFKLCFHVVHKVVHKMGVKGGGESGCKFNIVFSQFTCYKILWDMQFSFYCFTETNKGGLFFLCLCLSNPAVTCSSFYFKQLHTVYHCAYYWRYILKSSIFSIRKSRLILTSNKNYIPYFLCI